MKPWRYPVLNQANLDSFDAWTDDHANSQVINHVHVWCVRLDDFAKYQETLKSALSAEEKSRASRFFHLADRERFVMRRGLLRHILFSYTGLPPSQLKFDYEMNGKPLLQRPQTELSLSFSLSHSNGVAVYAVAKYGDVGIDVEQVLEVPDWQDIVQEHFSNREQAILRRIPENQRLETFYRGWTRKEAYLKATGQGIGDGLRQIEVSLEPGEAAKISRIEGSTASIKEWTLVDLPNFSGLVGALAIRASRAEIDVQICQVTRKCT